MSNIPVRQQHLLRYIIGFQEALGFAPSYIEMAEGIGVSSTSRLARMLDELEAGGHIRRLRKRARSVEVLTLLPIPRAPDGAPVYLVPGVPKPLRLTDMQWAAFGYIAEFHRDFGISPTLQQIADGAGLRSPQAAFAIVVRLGELGLLKTRQGGKRELVPLLEEAA